MTFKPTLLRRIAILLSVFNVGGAGFAVASGEAWHAGIHVSLARGIGKACRGLR